ncbi:U3 small nucleolar RNA-associated protein 10-like [Pollicipes pollicipes]|uniref:U3 small nucleolar RNA-associated protein 10-like n=1 Tax=Pollicipes pollicipes TaxID=41117 RepID=UPI0018850E6B|nr:U3 small nucleolar RNA-associated protein 10-like [Pollicipes pollicipes]
MATSLARQLERLAAPQSALVVHKKSRPSLLFDKREAALLDRDTVFSIGLDGFEDLLNLNPAFVKYQETLFSENAKTMERAVQTKEVNDQLDEVLEEFLCLACPYFLLKPTQKALEWLVYRFHIHEFNVNALLRCIFPYHDTNIFVRALQLLRLKEETNRWHWLHPLQNPGVPLTKAALAVQCAENLGFMKFLCLMNKKMMKVHGAGSTALHAPVAFFVTALSAGLERCDLSEPLAGERVTALAVLAQSQTLALAPAAALEPLSPSLPALTAALADLSQRCSVLQLLSCLLRTCVLESAKGDATAGTMATALISDVRVEDPREQERIIRSLTELFTAGEAEAKPLLAALCPLLAVTERMYPAPFDAALVGCGVFVDLNHPEESTRHEAVADSELVRSALLSALADESDRIVKLALKVPVEKSLELVSWEELSGRLTTCLDAGHGDQVRWLCARALARLETALKVSGALSAELTPLDLVRDAEHASPAAALLCVLVAVVDAAAETDVSDIQWWSAAAADSERLAALVAFAL